jgi:hypothetical protein
VAGAAVAGAAVVAGAPQDANSMAVASIRLNRTNIERFMKLPFLLDIIG